MVWYHMNQKKPHPDEFGVHRLCTIMKANVNTTQKLGGAFHQEMPKRKIMIKIKPQQKFYMVSGSLTLKPMFGSDGAAAPNGTITIAARKAGRAAWKASEVAEYIPLRGSMIGHCSLPNHVPKILQIRPKAEKTRKDMGKSKD